MGTGGTMVSGTAPEGSKAVTVLLFTEGKAFVNLEFDGPPNGPVPPNSSPTWPKNKTPQSRTDYTANHYGPLPQT